METKTVKTVECWHVDAVIGTAYAVKVPPEPETLAAKLGAETIAEKTVCIWPHDAKLYTIVYNPAEIRKEWPIETGLTKDGTCLFCGSIYVFNGPDLKHAENLTAWDGQILRRRTRLFRLPRPGKEILLQEILTDLVEVKV